MNSVTYGYHDFTKNELYSSLIAMADSGEFAKSERQISPESMKVISDFIQTLSVINEKFYITGRKGIIYIKNENTFRNGLIGTHNDTYEIIKSQKYIDDYQIYNNENIDTIIKDLNMIREDIITPRDPKASPRICKKTP